MSRLSLSSSGNGDGGPVYELKPSVVFGFGAAESFTATRWRFA